MSEAVRTLQGIDWFWYWFGFYSSAAVAAALVVGVVIVSFKLWEIVADVRQCLRKYAKENA